MNVTKIRDTARRKRVIEQIIVSKSSWKRLHVMVGPQPGEKRGRARCENCNATRENTRTAREEEPMCSGRKHGEEIGSGHLQIQGALDLRFEVTSVEADVERSCSVQRSCPNQDLTIVNHRPRHLHAGKQEHTSLRYKAMRFQFISPLITTSDTSSRSAVSMSNMSNI